MHDEANIFDVPSYAITASGYPAVLQNYFGLTANQAATESAHYPAANHPTPIAAMNIAIDDKDACASAAGESALAAKHPPSPTSSTRRTCRTSTTCPYRQAIISAPIMRPR